jgi:multimeric flavodoxin WrbA
MKIIVLNGSPRKHGTVATLLRAIVEGMAGSSNADVSVEVTYQTTCGFINNHRSRLPH